MFYDTNGKDEDIKDFETMEWQMELKQKKENKWDYNNGMRTGFTLTMGQIDSLVKQDLSIRNNWDNIVSNNLLIDMLELLTTICNGSANGKLKLMLLHGMVQMKKCLNYVQGKNIKDSNYKDSVKTQF